MIAAQQYYVEYSGEAAAAAVSQGIDPEKLYALLPNYIPDYCLQPGGSADASANAQAHWHSLIVQAYQKVLLDNSFSSRFKQLVLKTSILNRS